MTAAAEIDKGGGEDSFALAGGGGGEVLFHIGEASCPFPPCPPSTPFPGLPVPIGIGGLGFPAPTDICGGGVPVPMAIGGEEWFFSRDSEAVPEPARAFGPP